MNGQIFYLKNRSLKLKSTHLKTFNRENVNPIREREPQLAFWYISFQIFFTPTQGYTEIFDDF